MKKKITYAKSGVNIDEGNLLVKKIQPFVKKTLSTNTIGKTTSFAALYSLDLKGISNPVLVSCTDGVGTKVQLGVETNKIEGLGIDLVAMCVNDLICTGAKPLFFLDYLATSKLNSDYHSKVIKGIAKGCIDSNCSLVGGETAEMPGMYKPGEFDLAGFSVGLVDKKKIISPEKVKAGDILLGIPSSGPHSNGYSLIRKVYSGKNKAKIKGKFLNAVMKPTRLYPGLIHKLLSQPGFITGIANITGGGLKDNIERIIPDNYCAEINLEKIKTLKIFRWLKSQGVSDQEMLKTFNCGVGFCLIVKRSNYKKVIRLFPKKYKPYVIGKITKNSEKVKLSGKNNYIKGIANLGYRPTFNGKKILLEVHLFNFSGNLYNKYLTVEFKKFIRKEKKFKNVEQLRRQIKIDLLLAKK